MIIYDEEKNIKLKKERNVCFEQAIELIESDDVIAKIKNPVRENQKMYVININNYIYAVPFVVDDEDNIFLKTIYPSRKLNKKYGVKNEEK